jgi:hypothetical protein
MADQQTAGPVRVQLRRLKGWRMPANTVKVCRPGRWGNQFIVGRDGTAAECVAKFRNHLMPFRHGGPMEDFLISEANIKAARSDLAGKNLACWCAPDQPCHADVLLEIANA